MKCKYCDEGLVVKVVRHEADSNGNFVPVIEWDFCPCCGGIYSDCKNCEAEKCTEKG